MLILSRKIGEKLIIDGDIEVSILSQKGNQFQIGINAPDDVIVDREEIHKKRISGEWKEAK
jgi:carbon storage regulator